MCSPFTAIPVPGVAHLTTQEYAHILDALQTATLAVPSRHPDHERINNGLRVLREARHRSGL